jgi:transposase-like protein
MSQLSVVPRQYSPEERARIIEQALAHVENAGSLELVAEQVGVPVSTLDGWLRADVALQCRYEQLKITRSRALMERALHEMYENPDYKQAEARARVLMRMAALFNPGEYSERVHSTARNGQAAGRVSFTLNFGGAAPALGESVTVTVNENEE